MIFLVHRRKERDIVQNVVVHSVLTSNSIFTKDTFLYHKPLSFSNNRLSTFGSCQISHQSRATTAPMEAEQSEGSTDSSSQTMNHLLFVEMGVGYDQHGQNITSAAMRACRDAISSNSIPAFRRGNHRFFWVSTVC